MNRLIHKGLILVGVPLVLSIIVVCFMFALILQNDRDRLEEARHRQLADNAGRSILLLHDIFICVENIVMPKSGSNARQGIADAKIKVREDMETLHQLRDENMALDPTLESSRQAVQFQTLVDDSVEMMRNLLSAFKHKGVSLDSLAMLQHYRKDIAKRTFTIAWEAHRIDMESLHFLEASPKKQLDTFHFEIVVLIGGVIASILTGLLLARWFMSDISSRLRVITENTVRMTRNEQLNPPLSGSDEIANLDHGFHSMAEALRQAIAREHALFESASDMICVIDENLRLTSVNPASSRVVGYTPDELVGRPLLDFVAPDDREATGEALRLTQTSSPAAMFENRMLSKEGQTLDLLWSVYWSELDKALYTVAHDISEQKQLERVKEEFLAMVSHDLRSPLTSVFGTFKLLAAGAFGKLGDAINHKIALAVTDVNRLLSLINDLLDIEKLEAGKLEMVLEDTNIAAALKRAVAEMQAVADDRGIKLQVLDAPGLSCRIDGDRITQVVGNLLSCAIRMAPAGSEIRLRAYPTKTNNLRVEVIGAGQPFTEMQKQKIFERFSEDDAQNQTSRSATGMELPICKLIVAAHGGEIGVETPTESNCFWFEVPADGKRAVGSSASRRQLVKVGTSANQTESGRTVAVAPPSLPPRRRTGFLSFANLSLVKKGAILVIVPVIFELAMTGTLFGLLGQAFHEKQKELTERLVANYASELLLSHAILAFTMSLEGPEHTWAVFNECVDSADHCKTELAKLTANRPGESQFVQSLEPYMGPVQRFIIKARAAVAKAGGPTDASLNEAFSGRDDLMLVARDVAPRLQGLVDRATDQGDLSPARLDEIRGRQGATLIFSLLVSAGICALSALLFSEGVARRLAVTEENVKRLEQDQPLNPTLPGTDEVAHLDQFFHSMSEALHEARRKEKAVFDNSQDGILSIDSGGFIGSANPAAERLFGRSRSELQSKSVYDITAADYFEQTKQAFADVSGASEPQTIESRIVRQDGSTCDVLWSLSWSADQQSVIAIAHDISQRKQLEKLKGQFLQVVSQDMRTPLAAIAATTEMIGQGSLGELPEKALKQLEVVSRNCNRLLTLINDLVDIEKLDSGNIKLTVATVSAASVLHRTAEALTQIAMQKEINVIVEAAPELLVEADGDRLVQVGVNLLSNAIKFSDQGGTVYLRAAAAAGDRVEFAVSDRGRGIPESHLQSVFEKFQQVEAADGKRKSGTGLGLPICKQIVEQHGGEIGVNSRVGEGSTFFFRIPATKNVAART
jgi:PAS domain S-box-containing protein